MQLGANINENFNTTKTRFLILNNFNLFFNNLINKRFRKNLIVFSFTKVLSP